jgi:outer membrane protein TolC
LEQQLDDAKNFYEQGLFAKNDYLQVDVELSSAQQALLVSKRNIRIAFYKLKRELGGNLKKDETIETIKRNEKELINHTLKEKMLENRSELKLLKAQKKSINYSYEASASNYYPKADAELKYEVAGDDVIPDGGVNFKTNEQTTASLYLTWNLYSGGSDEANRASLLYQDRASNEQINELFLELDFQLEDAVSAYDLALSQIKVASKALLQAKENFRITKNQFDANIANTTLMLDAQRFLARTQVDYYSAYFAMYEAMAKIERVVEEEIF